MAINVRLLENQPKVGRVSRRPKHPFSLRTRPWQIQPFMIAPVMPGETMKNLLLQSRTVTKPIKNKLVGWWCEYMFFYVKHRDLSIASNLIDMHMKNTPLPGGLRNVTYSPGYNTGVNSVNYVQYCWESVVTHWFRMEGDGAWNAPNIGGIPIANINHITGLESLRSGADAAPVQDHETPGEVSTLPFGVDAAWADEYEQWQSMRALKLTEVSFEDYLRQFGVKTKEIQEDESRPELIRHMREFSYPTNTVEPTTGVASSAVVWSSADRADKDRYFSEPGFIFGVQVVRPKVYFSGQKGALVGYLDDAFAWLPAASMDQGWTTVRNYNFDTGPLAGAEGSGSYWLDLRDLYVYGDQYVNYAVAAGDPIVSLPSGGFKSRYASATDADNLFVGATAATRLIETDGVVSLSILGKVVNQT